MYLRAGEPNWQPLQKLAREFDDVPTSILYRLANALPDTAKRQIRVGEGRAVWLVDLNVLFPEPTP